MGRVAMVATIAGVAVGGARAADHRDGPRISSSSSTTGNLDLNDLYVFRGPTGNTVLIMTLAPGAGLISPNTFVPGAYYDFKIDNTGDAHEDLTLRFIFSDPDGAGRQAYRVFAMNAAGQAPVLASGLTGRTTNIRGGGQVTAGIFDDPFFFDLLAFLKFETAVQEGKPLADRVAPFLPPNVPNNFFANFNALAIVLELPRAKLQSSKRNTHINVWIRTETQGHQFDRMGLPAINTAVNFLQSDALPSLQDAFNTLSPSDDTALRGEAAKRLVSAYGLPQAPADAPAAAVLPDMMPFDTTSGAGFLNGRKLNDDVIDAEFSLLTAGKLKSDRVINDSKFRVKFPYLGVALPPAAGREALRMIQQGDAPASSPDGD